MTSNRALAIVLLPLALALAFVVGSSTTPEPPSLRDATVSVCEWTEDFNSDSGAMLLSAGWEGHPADGRERLYSPACHVTVQGNKIVVSEAYQTIATFPASMVVMPE